jgi:hypothetical protein
VRSWHLARFSIADSFAETINAFCGFDDADVKSKILVRIHSILVLENRLVHYMKIGAFDPASICPQFTPKAGMASIVHDKKKSKPFVTWNSAQLALFAIPISWCAKAPSSLNPTKFLESLLQ